MEQFGNPNLVKKLHLDSDGRDKVIEGANKLARAVSSTLGASGRNVLVEDMFGNVQSTKDGVSVASYITLECPVENMGATLLKQAAKKTATVAGDGTTSATVLGAAIINTYQESTLKDQYSFRDFKTGVEMARDLILEQLTERSIPVDDKMLEEVSIISANNDKELGSLIAEAYKLAGEHGVVTVSDSVTNDTHITSVEGTHITETCQVAHFFTNKTKEICELEKPLILLSSVKIDNLRELNTVLEYTLKANRSILIVAPLGQQPLSALATNALKGNIRVNVVAPPSFGLRQQDLLEDMALLTGATVIDESLGDAIDRITPTLLGGAVSAISDKDGTTLITDHDAKAVKARVDQLKTDLDSEDHHVLKSHLERRLALLTGGVCQIFVGAETGVAQKEKMDRVDDATSAVRAAKKAGILPGGGAALHVLSDEVDSPDCSHAVYFGFDTLMEALKEPFNQILKNSGLDPADFTHEMTKWGLGVNTITGEVTTMIDEGIIDPTLVTQEVVKNAVSVALTVLSSDVIISNVRDNG